MLSDLLFSINAVFPIILVASFGFIARKLNIIDDAFVKSGNKFCFRFGFFAMMFVNIYKIESLDKIRWNVVLFAVISVLALFFIGLFWIVFFPFDSVLLNAESEITARILKAGTENAEIRDASKSPSSPTMLNASGIPIVA